MSISTTTPDTTVPSPTEIDFDEAVRALVDLRRRRVTVSAFNGHDGDPYRETLFPKVVGPLGYSSSAKLHHFSVTLADGRLPCCTTFRLDPGTFVSASLIGEQVCVVSEYEDGYCESVAVRPV